MSLFHIDRYLGEDEEKVSEDQPYILLQQLQNQIKEKQKAKAALPLYPTSINRDSSVSSKRKRGNENETKVRNKKIKKSDHLKGSNYLRKNLEFEVKAEGQEKRIEPAIVKYGSKHQQESNVENRVCKEENTESSIGQGHIEEVITEQEQNEPEDKRVKEGPHVVGNFTVLGGYGTEKNIEVKHKLPDWLAEPGIISSSLTETPVSELKVLGETLSIKLQENNISHLFPVQTQILPLLLRQVTNDNCYGKDGFQPSDMCVSVPTGSGKTLAFALPIIQALLHRVVCRVRALVVLPVRDLALQVYKVFQTYCKGTGLRVTLLGGHSTFQIEQESLVVKRLNGIYSLSDIVIATPGRLVDHINKTHGFELDHLRFLVIDEADRMMENVKQDWLSQVENAVLRVHKREWNILDRCQLQPITVQNCIKIRIALQKLLFSATLSQDPERLQQLNLFQPKLFTSLMQSPFSSSKKTKEDNVEILEDLVGKYTTPDTLKERHIECKAHQKPLTVLHCIHNLKYRQILCFTNSVESTHRLFLLVKLWGGIKVKEFSSALSVSARQKILEEFSSGKVEMIICSDAMARGIDIENVKYVILYDKPNHIQTYIHRVGRTARAGKNGTAITILKRSEVCSYKAMLKEAGKQKFKKLKIRSSKKLLLKDMYRQSLSKLSGIIKIEKQEKRKAH